MKTFLVIYGMPATAMDEMKANWTEEQMQQGKKDWMQWMSDHKDQMADTGNPVGKNTRLSERGTEEVSNEIAGYSIFKGESKEAVVECIKDSPHFDVPGGYIEVMEIVNMM